MNIYLKLKNCQSTIISLLLLLLFNGQLHSQTTTIQGTIKDSISGEPISYVTVRFDNSTIGGASDESGKFRISNNQNNNKVIFSFMGYNTKTVIIPTGIKSDMEILLNPTAVHLDEVIVRPEKAKYSKKNNPAVELIKKVIEQKEKYLITNQDYYQSNEYERLFFALNEFDVTQPQFSSFKFLTDYTTTSKINEKLILPFSVRETSSDLYYRKNPKDTRRVVKAYNNEGIDQILDTEALDAIVAETFKDVSITDNKINLLFQDFVGPLSSQQSIDFYKWYIIDSVLIDQNKYINLGFVPFNTRDVGFSGNLLVKADSTYAIKQVLIRVPRNINVNFVDEMLVKQEFKQISPTLWIPLEFTTAIEFSLYHKIKVYVEKIKTFQNFTFNQPVDAIFYNPSPEIYLSDYKKQNKDFWIENRPPSSNEDYQMNEMMNQLRSDKLIDITMKVAKVLSSGYIATSSDPDKNKFDIGTVQTFYSFNRIEGNRFRLTGATTKNFHPNIFLYGYIAYGTRDNKLKYMSEVSWAFNKREYHKDEFPIHNISISYKYDLNALGQRFLNAERDNIVMSSNKEKKLTYDQMSRIEYVREYHNGFSFNTFAATQNSRPAGTLAFERKLDFNTLDTISNLRTTELALILRYAPNEKFFQSRRVRKGMPNKNVVYTFSLSSGIKGFLGGQYNYQKTSLSISKQFRIAPFGKIDASIQGEKIWGVVPFPLLLAGNANTSYTIQGGSFDLLRPLEFINDAQFSWHTNYSMGGWLFNRIPLIKRLNWREFFAFRGFLGSLSPKNNPENNKELMMFPIDTHSMNNIPYMEYSVGIENIFQFFRVIYVRRINHLDNLNIDKDGFRIGFDMSF